MQEKSALILHAWHNTPQNHWYPWLIRELESRGYTVHAPEIPTMNTDKPELPTQLQYIETHVPLSEHMIVFGHSLGCLLGMRLAEKHAVEKLFLVAGWDFDDLTAEHQSFWPNKLNHAKIKEHVKNIYVLSTNNDPYMTDFTMKEMSKRLSAEYIFIENAGHFTKDSGYTKIPEILSYV